MVKKNGQLGQPATREDVESAVDELAQITEKNFRRVDARLGKIDGRLDGHDSRFDRIERALKMILSIVRGIDRDNQDFKSKNLPERVSTLEEDVLKLKAKAY